MSQPALPGMAAPTPVGDPLGRCFTPDALALACLEWLLQRRAVDGLGPPQVYVEPSVGGGAFVRAARKLLPGARVIGVDLDPSAAGLRLCDEAHVGDWVTVAPMLARAPGNDHPGVLVAGNPPFDDPPSHWHARDHVRATRLHLPQADLGFILPLAYLGVVGWDELLQTDTPNLPRILGRPWPARLREAALYHWPGAGSLPRGRGHIGRVDWSG